LLIERTNSEIIFRLPNTINFDELQDIANFFKYKELTKKSKATQKQIDALIKEVKKGRWEKTRAKIGL
jgi:hypothetical protein